MSDSSEENSESDFIVDSDESISSDEEETSGLSEESEESDENPKKSSKRRENVKNPFVSSDSEEIDERPKRSPKSQKKEEIKDAFTKLKAKRNAKIKQNFQKRIKNEVQSDESNNSGNDDLKKNLNHDDSDPSTSENYLTPRSSDSEESEKFKSRSTRSLKSRRKEERNQELSKLKAKRNAKKKLDFQKMIKKELQSDDEETNNSGDKNDSKENLDHDSESDFMSSDPSTSRKCLNSRNKISRKRKRLIIDSSNSEDSDESDSSRTTKIQVKEEQNQESMKNAKKRLHFKENRSLQSDEEVLEDSSENLENFEGTENESDEQEQEDQSEDSSIESEYEDDDFVVPETSSRSRVELEMQKITQNLSRTSQNDQENRDKYFQSLYEPKRKTPQKKEAKKEEADPEIYQNLVNGLRKYATDPDLPDEEIIKEFISVGFDTDDSKSEECVCGKRELKYLYYMKNLKMKKLTDEGKLDLVDYATNTFIVGSKCINTFYTVKNHHKKFWNLAKPLEKEFMRWAQDGVVGNIRQKRGKEWKITFESRFLVQDFKAFQKEYKAKIRHKINDAIDLIVKVENKTLTRIRKRYKADLKIDSRHKFFLSFKIPDREILLYPLPIQFYLSSLTTAAKTDNYKSSEPTSGKDFFK